MDNNTLPLPQTNGMQPASTMPGAMNASGVSPVSVATSASVAPPVSAAMPEVQPNMMASTNVPSGAPVRNDTSGLVKTIAIVVLSLIAVTFVGLFIWMTVQYNDVSTDVNGQIKTAVDAAVDDNTMELEMEFAEREKEPYRDFAGPADYGGLSFKYPKTWSLYVGSDASKGGDYTAYFNPIEVSTVSDSSINALRVSILDKAFDDVAADYQRYLERKDSNLSVTAVSVAGVAANRYTGRIPNTELEGIIVIFKIRDKTAVLRTDSMLFEADFNRLLETVAFNA